MNGAWEELWGLRYEQIDGYNVLEVHGPVVPNTIASVLLHIRDVTGLMPHIYFRWTEGNPITNLLRFLFVAVLVVVVAVGAGACSGGDDGGVSTGPSPTSRGSTSEAPPAASSYVGLSKRAAIARAEAAEVPWRILREDDEVFLVTQDYLPDRVNFEIDDGTVTKTTTG